MDLNWGVAVLRNGAVMLITSRAADFLRDQVAVRRKSIYPCGLGTDGFQLHKSDKRVQN
jgi:hypothetical protein